MTSPLEKYDTEHESRWEVLVDIPVWEESRLLTWIEGVLSHPIRDEWGNLKSGFDNTVLPTIQRKERIIFTDLGLNTGSWSQVKGSLCELMESNPERFILVLETLVKYVRDNGNSSGEVNFFSRARKSSFVLDMLNNILTNGSKWRIVVTQGAKAGLEERANEQLTEVAKKLGNSDLVEAWNYAFGTKPDSKQAIEKAQNAIEYYATKVGLTKSKTSVFGTLLGDIKIHSENYESAAVEQFAQQDNAHKGEMLDGSLNDMMSAWFWHTMNLIQKTNVMRHKNNENHGYVIPVEAARQAVLMATILCEMIDKEYFKRGDHRKLAKV